MTSEIERLIQNGSKKIALNLGQSQFLSLPTIRFLNLKARQLKAQGGQFVLLAPSLKTRRHIEIYSRLDDFQIFEKIDDFHVMTATPNWFYIL